MQYLSSHPSPPQHGSQAWTDWMRPSRAENSSWDSHLVRMLTDDLDDEPSHVAGTAAVPMEYTLTPPTPGLDSDHTSSQCSFDSSLATELDDYPEIPFISNDGSLSSGTIDPDAYSVKSYTASERNFWSSLIRPNLSKSPERPTVLLGQTSQRVVSPTRRRAPSVSSSTSSRSRPAPAKSILSSSSSIRTTRKHGRSPPSVKFLDMPTIHYEDEDEEMDDFGDDDDEESRDVDDDCDLAAKSKWTWGFLKRFIGGPRKSGPAAPERPRISGPIPLCETPNIIRRSLDERRPTRQPTMASLRSVRSNGSIRSTRSNQSRIQTYWGRLGGKDP